MVNETSIFLVLSVTVTVLLQQVIIIVLLTNRVHPTRESGSPNISAVRRDFYDAVMEELVFNN